MAFTSVNGGALFGTVIPIIRTAIFSSPTVSGEVSIGSIAGKFTSYTVTRGGTNIATAQTASTYTDTSLSNNTQYTYTIVPYMNGAKGIAFTAIVNPNNAGTPGKIYTLASKSTLSLTYNGAGSSTTVVSFTWIGTANNFNSLSIQYPNGTALSTPAYAATTQTYTSGSTLVTNTQYTYYVYAINGDGIGSGLAACQSTINVCTWATAPTLTYNGAGCSTSQISFTFSGGAYTNLSVQYPSGAEITKTTTSPYTGGAFSANQQVTYYVFPINALAYISSNGSSVAVCTWGSCNAPTFSSVTSTGVTVAVGGTYTNAVVTYTSGISGSPDSGTSTLYSTLSVGKAYSTFTAGSNVTFVAAPVNALGYQSTNTSTATQQLTVLVLSSTFGSALFNSGGRVASIGTNTNNGSISSWAISTGGKVILYSIGNINSTATVGGTQQVYMNDGNFGTTFTNINSNLSYMWEGTGGRILSIGITNDGTKIVIFMYYTGTAASKTTASVSPAWYVSTNGTLGSSGATFTLYTGATGTKSFLGPGQGQCKFSSDNNWCFASPLNGSGYNNSFFRNTTSGNFTAWTGYGYFSGNGPVDAPFCLNSNASIMYCTGGWFGGVTLMKSTNTGVTWAQTASGVLSTGWATNCVGCDSTGNIVYCTTLYTTGYYSRMFKSTNAGSTWAEVTLPFGSTNWVSWFEVDSTGNNIVILNGGAGNANPNCGSGINPTTVTGLYISTNGGTNWTATTGYPTTYNPSYPSGIFSDSTFTVFGLCTSSSTGALSPFGMLSSFGAGRLF